jgi:hypothetical protein
MLFMSQSDVRLMAFVSLAAYRPGRRVLGERKPMPRVTMILTDRDAANTLKIKESAHARSNAHAVSIAITLTAFIVDALREGDSLLLEKPDGKVEKIVMAELAGISPSK